MLIHQTDYLTIDAEKVSYVKHLASEPEPKEDNAYKLRLHITIQCNGKIRRSVLDVEVAYAVNPNEMDSEKTWNAKKNTSYRIKDYDVIYNIFQLIKDLGYEIPTEIDANDMIMEAMEVFSD